MTHTQPRPSCWTDSATPRLWLASDKIGRRPVRDEARECRGYPMLSDPVRAACEGCARIEGEAA